MKGRRPAPDANRAAPYGGGVIPPRCPTGESPRWIIAQPLPFAGAQAGPVVDALRLEGGRERDRRLGPTIARAAGQILAVLVQTHGRDYRGLSRAGQC